MPKRGNPGTAAKNRETLTLKHWHYKEHYKERKELLCECDALIEEKKRETTLGSRYAHMKEPGYSQVSTADPGRKRKKRKGGTSFSNSKQRRRRELRKKEQTCSQGSEPPTDLSKTGGKDETDTLERIEEEQEQSGSRDQSMGESEHINSDTSGSDEETKEDSWQCKYGYICL